MQAYDDLRCDVGYLFRYYVTNDQGAENDTWDENKSMVYPDRL